MTGQLVARLRQFALAHTERIERVVVVRLGRFVNRERVHQSLNLRLHVGGKGAVHVA